VSGDEARVQALESLDELLEMIARGRGSPTGGILAADLVQLEGLSPDGSSRVSSALRAAYTIGLVRARTRVAMAVPAERVPFEVDKRPLSAREWRLAAQDACAPFRPERAVAVTDAGP